MKADILIIGLGPAGMTAMIYALRAGKSVIAVDKNEYGGMMNLSPRIENFPGHPSSPGLDIAEDMMSQISELLKKNTESKILTYTEVTSLGKIEDKFLAVAKNYLEETLEIESKGVILATGTTQRGLGIEGEDLERISYCVLCDGPLYEGGDVVVIGGGNTGAQYAVELINMGVNHVTLCEALPNIRCEDTLLKTLTGNERITVKTNVKVQKFVGDHGVVCKVQTTDEEIPADGVFIAAGLVPNKDVTHSLVETNERGYYKSIGECRTSCPGLCVAGDCRDKTIRQAITAASDGAIAAAQIVDYINKVM